MVVVRGRECFNFDSFNITMTSFPMKLVTSCGGYASCQLGLNRSKVYTFKQHSQFKASQWSGGEGGGLPLLSETVAIRIIV